MDTSLNLSDMVHTDLDSFCFSCTGFTRNENRLVDPVNGQSAKGESGGFIDVRFQEGARIFIVLRPYKLVTIVFPLLRCVQFMEPLVRIHRDDNITGARVGLLACMPGLQVVQNGSLQRKKRKICA